MKITWREFLGQLVADLIGKDSHRGVTLTYSWLANQFGHFSLGFIPTSLLYAFLMKFTSLNNSSLWAALIVSGFWFVFELYNFLAPLLSRKRTRYGLFWIAGAKYQFKPKFWNIGFDTFTDLCFFWLGACAAAVAIKLSVLLLYFIGPLIIIIIPAGIYWYATKMYLQYAQYPAQFRLSQYDGHISDDDKVVVHDFLKKEWKKKRTDPPTPLNLFVFGPAGSGKTPLGIGIATELSIRHQPCLYVTAMKLFSMFCEPEPDGKPKDKKYLWLWRKASVLVIDDINPGEPIPDIITSGQFLAMIDLAVGGRKAMAKKKIIWVLGNQDTDEMYLENWREMLRTIGVEEKNIKSINLQKENDRKDMTMAEYDSHRRN